MKHLIRKAGIVAYWLGWPAYHVYFRLSARTRMLVVCGADVLVVSSWVSDGRWSLPGGGLHRGEDPVDGVLREVREEVGIAIPKADVRLLGSQVYRGHGHRYAYFQFVVQVAERPAIRRQWHEIADARWVDYRGLTAQVATPDVLEMTRKHFG